MTIRIKHKNTRKSLHSHGIRYHQGSHQQEVTGYHGRDSNDLWIIRHKRGNKLYFNNRDIVKLTHRNTKKNLHSHHIRSPVSHQQEVSAYGRNGRGDGNDYWRVIIRRRSRLTRGHYFRLQHVNTGRFLHSHGLRLRNGSRQQEVTAYHHRDSNDYWYVQDAAGGRRPPRRRRHHKKKHHNRRRHHHKKKVHHRRHHAHHHKKKPVPKVTKAGKVQYKYKCCPAKVTHCKHYYTKSTSYGNFGNIYLDRQHVKTPLIDTQAITGFRLLNNYSKRSWRYKVEYCTITG